MFCALAFISAQLIFSIYHSMQDILEDATKKVVELEERRHQEVVNMTFDLIVNKGKKTIWRNLHPSFDMVSVCLGTGELKL